jgi:hypothetical protein
MRSPALVAAGLAASLVAPAAPADDGYRHGRVRFVEPGVTLQRATEVSAEEALANLPFLPGDRVWTDSAGRAEFQFPDGTAVRLDTRSKLDYAGHAEGEDERIVLRLWSGSVIVRVRTRGNVRFEVETPAGAVQALERGIVRLDVDAGETRLSVYAGEAVLDDGRQRVRLAAGERTYARWGAEAEEPRRFEPGEDADDFARWDETREAEERWASRSSEYLPDELDAYAGEFEANGRWQYEGTAGYVWIPSVGIGWQPYTYGHWAWTPYGWTWVPYEHWGWAPFHYGRWGFSASFGWYWAPGHTWGPAWVSWAVGGGYVGWCPLGWRDRPVTPWGHHRGHAVPRGRHGSGDGWNVVRHGDLGGRDLARRRVGLDRIDPTALRVADSTAFRPSRDGRSLREADPVPRAISRRPSPGDFVRELGVDNKTTIPAPWTRGYGPPPAGVDGARYGTPRRTDRSDEERPSRTWATPTTRRGTEPAPAAAGGSTSGSGRGSESAVSPRRAPRPAQWLTPRTPESPTAPRPDRSERVEGGGGGGVRRPRGGTEGSSAYRPRGGGGESSGASRPRGSSGGASSGGSRARPAGGGDGGSRGGGSSARPSGGQSRGSGGGHAVPRSRRN